MRLFVRVIYRAFPELDGYSDEQCERFVEAAKRGWTRRLVHWPVLTVASAVAIIATTILGTGAGLWLSRLITERQNDRLSDLYVALGLFMVGVPLLGLVYLLRNRLLRRRIGWLLRKRGQCVGCRYNLVGLPVGDDGVVTCPECGHTTRVDPALGELVRSENGPAIFRPNEKPLPP